MVIKTILYTLGIYFLAKCLIILLFEKSIIGWVSKIIKKKNSIKLIAVLEIILAIMFLVIGYFL
jgi:hypothetical protein